MFTTNFKLVNRMPEAAQNLEQQVSQAVAEAAQEAKSLAAQFALVSDNNTSGHVHLRDTLAAYRKTALSWVVGAMAPYARAVEVGTMYMQALPFLSPAIEAVRPRLLKKLQKLKVL